MMAAGVPVPRATGARSNPAPRDDAVAAQLPAGPVAAAVRHSGRAEPP